jgi:NADH-quinone oxidoreductase subunit A
MNGVSGIWPALVYGAATIIIVAGILALSYVLGERHRSDQCDEPYESGIKPTGSARLRYNVRYYLVALFFILFDIEVAIVISWAVAFRELGWRGYAEAALFLAVLVVGLVYVWKLGGLDWRPDGKDEMSNLSDGEHVD